MSNSLGPTKAHSFFPIMFPARYTFLIHIEMHVWIQRGGGEGVRTPLKNHKNIGFSSKLNTGPDPLKNRSYQASIQCWAIIRTPGKRHLTAFRWRADDGPLKVVLGSSLPLSTIKKSCQSWTLSDKTFWIRA